MTSTKKGIGMAMITLLCVAHLHASTEFETATEMDIKYNTIKTVKLIEVTPDVLNQNKNVVLETVEMDQDTEYPNYYFPNQYGRLDDYGQDRVGRVIKNGRDLVALGEDLYRLVIKGKPTNTTTYVPISVIPKINGNPIDIFDTENWKQLPMVKTFSVVYTNYFNIDVVKFTYSVIYSYGGSYEGKGAYLTAAQIVPKSVSTLFGFDFTATMKVGGIQNNGTKANPLAAATMLLEYNVSSLIKTITTTDTYFIQGNGKFKQL